MTAADVDVPELVARAVHEAIAAIAGEPIETWNDVPADDVQEWLSVGRKTLAALRSPEVLAGIAGVLRDADDEWARLHADAPQGHPPTRSQWQARAVVEWLAGGAR